ncbi:MAG: hypothetical protein GQ470_01065, partial [Gammaproteobacteria bacterium]|nr:hypothetical protein [Gammaproteobacteria bacterium]
MPESVITAQQPSTTQLLEQLPEILRDGVAQVWEELSEITDCENLLQGSSQLSEIFKVLASSKFISQQFQRKSHLLGELIESGDLEHPYSRDELSQRLAKMISEIEDEETLAREIRIFRQR